ncbi:SDR family NAD(P)-dependent oxidoreductase [Nocardioides convexus]|uniref:SDR family NAD(P)-dependent oxidoreductase n=1 Tax=Nocardioides convexus TaxID=2712224 RepID=UPI002418820F|nr:SDR family NAD(P)-dependent oxidoreductase [Nocardioides convexus]
MPHPEPDPITEPITEPISRIDPDEPGDRDQGAPPDPRAPPRPRRRADDEARGVVHVQSRSRSRGVPRSGRSDSATTRRSSRGPRPDPGCGSTTRPPGSRWSRPLRAPSPVSLITARGCYICKEDFTLVDAFYHWLCPRCAAMSHAKRDQRTDLTGKRALLTGGRAKIGMYIALRLLRDGAHTTITTRFPKDAVRRFAAMEDSADWLHRLKVVGIDLRDPTQVISLTDDVAADGPLDIIINNACQTVRRLPGAYSHLTEGEWRRCPRASSRPRWSPSTGSPRRTRPPSPVPWRRTPWRTTRASRRPRRSPRTTPPP